MASAGANRLFPLLASIVRTVASVIGGLIVVHAVFVLFEANPANTLVEFTAGIRDAFGGFTEDLFQPSDPKVGEAINDGLAALIWVVVGNVVSKLLVRLAPTTGARA